MNIPDCPHGRKSFPDAASAASVKNSAPQHDGAALTLDKAAGELAMRGLFISYQKFRRAAAGRIPAKRVGLKPQWMIARDDLPAIIAALSPSPARDCAA